MVEVEEGLYRVTFSLPLGIDHVHCYLVRSSNGFILIDTGLGSRDPEKRWRPVLDSLDAPIETIVVTHMHPDHVGGARDIAGLTGAPVYQGRIDHAQCALAWGERNPERFAEYWSLHGMPRETVDGIVSESGRLVDAVHWVEQPDRLLDAGDEIDGWQVHVLPGHADGHIVLERGGVVLAGDTILTGITPAVGLYPNSRPDPLGDYLESLRWYVERAPRVAFTGHREPVTDPAGRAAEITSHHAHRLDRAEAALDGTPLTAYDVSLALFEDDLSTTLRRFATAEALAHLERLVLEGRAARAGSAYVRAAIP
jgi:glyoxylase-like metal-dependent hydrolase (beta-lactamase superfamily II)